MRYIFSFCFILLFSMVGFSEEKIIKVPSQMTVELIMSNESGLYNGNFDVRARIYDSVTRERIWFEDYDNYPVNDGSLVLIMNSVPSLNAYDLHRKKLKLVVSLGSETAEIPLLTELYAYRSLFSEFGWDTRFPHIFKIDRAKEFIGIGITEPKAHVDVNGAIKLAYEETEVTGSIRWESNSLRVKHPQGWVDLLYGPLTFEASRWFEYPNNIQLVSQNYRIGIGQDFPNHKLHVEGSVYFAGGLNATSLTASQLAINSFSLTDDLLKAQSVYFKDSDRIMEWTLNNLKIIHGSLTGDGLELTNVGQLEKDFALKMIASSHLDGAVIASRNIYPNSIRSVHFADNNLDVDRFETRIFNSATISENSIVSANIMKNSLSFDVLKDNNLNDYVPDNFFNSNVIANNSVFASNIQDYQIASLNFSLNSIDSVHIKDDLILANHIKANQVLPSKIKSGQITSQLFSGKLALTNGGTGLSNLRTHRILSLGSGSFNPTTSIYLDDDLNLGVYDSTNLIQIERDFLYPLEVGSLDASADVRIKDVGANPVKIDIENTANDMTFELKSSGEFVFDDGSHQFFLHSPSALSTTLGNSQVQFDLGSAITIGDSANSAPAAGTFEFNETGFRFYNGTSWRVVSQFQHGIGVPEAIGNNQLNIEDTYLGQVENSNLDLTQSLVFKTEGSNLAGTQLSINHSINSSAHGRDLIVGQIESAHIKSESSYFDYVFDSRIFVNSGYFRAVSNAMVEGHGILLSNGEDIRFKGDALVLNNVEQLVGSFSNSVIENAADVNLNGRSLVIRGLNNGLIHSENSAVNLTNGMHMYGNSNTVSNAHDIRLNGDQNTIRSSSKVMIEGDNNVVMGVENVMVKGNDQRIFGDQNKIEGHSNVVIGNQIQIDGNNNVVLNASSDPIDVDGNGQVVLNAPNGVHIYTGEGMVVSATEAGGGWGMVSDRSLKTKFMPVDHHVVFDQLMDLKISKWEYVFNQGINHMGPMAQHFKSAFNIGEDERFITASDADGVAYSALKFLIDETDNLQLNYSAVSNIKLENLDRMINQIDQKIDAFETSLKMKKSAMATLVKNNLTQYQMIDKQLKVIARFIDQVNTTYILISFLQLFGLLIFGIAVGFYGLKLYHKKRDLGEE